jgi:DNA invertase Pin-like site-specific DNA recombinase
MIASIYARKSTDDDRNEDARSTTRQIERAHEYAARHGWTVPPEHVYVDEGISGAEFIKRPGYRRLMEALYPRRPFHALVMSEESRLGRDQIETMYALKQIIEAGVQVFVYPSLGPPRRDVTSRGPLSCLCSTEHAGRGCRDRAAS